MACHMQQQRTILELQGSIQALASEMLELRAAVAALQNASNHDNTETTITVAGGNEPPWNAGTTCHHVGTECQHEGTT